MQRARATNAELAMQVEKLVNNHHRVNARLEQVQDDYRQKLQKLERENEQLKLDLALQVPPPSQPTPLGSSSLPLQGHPPEAGNPEINLEVTSNTDHDALELDYPISGVENSRSSASSLLLNPRASTPGEHKDDTGPKADPGTGQKCYPLRTAKRKRSLSASPISMPARKLAKRASAPPVAFVTSPRDEDDTDTEDDEDNEDESPPSATMTGPSKKSGKQQVQGIPEGTLDDMEKWVSNNGKESDLALSRENRALTIEEAKTVLKLKEDLRSGMEWNFKNVRHISSPFIISIYTRSSRLHNEISATCTSLC